jgi:hypothetical protein
MTRGRVITDEERRRGHASRRVDLGRHRRWVRRTLSDLRVEHQLGDDLSNASAPTAGPIPGQLSGHDRTVVISECRRRGMSLRAIARVVGVSHQAVQKQLRKQSLATELPPDPDTAPEPEPEPLSPPVTGYPRWVDGPGSVGAIVAVALARAWVALEDRRRAERLANPPVTTPVSGTAWHPPARWTLPRLWWHFERALPRDGATRAGHAVARARRRWRSRSPRAL